MQEVPGDTKSVTPSVKRQRTFPSEPAVEPTNVTPKKSGRGAVTGNDHLTLRVTENWLFGSLGGNIGLTCARALIEVQVCLSSNGNPLDAVIWQLRIFPEESEVIFANTNPSCPSIILSIG